MPTELERSDMQGLLVSAYAHLPCATYRLLRITDPAAARPWLLSATDAVKWLLEQTGLAEPGA